MTTPSFLMSEPQHQYFLGEMARLKPKSNCSAGYRGVRANWYPFVFTAKIIAMHPSNSLLVPILHKHSERLLRAQIEAHAKELGPEDRKKFLGKQFDAVTDAISEKLAMSYKDAPVLAEWDSNVIKSSIKSWVIFLAGEANFTLGIDDSIGTRAASQFFSHHTLNANRSSRSPQRRGLRQWLSRAADALKS
jgi:hypothetical protein